MAKYFSKNFNKINNNNNNNNLIYAQVNHVVQEQQPTRQVVSICLCGSMEVRLSETCCEKSSTHNARQCSMLFFFIIIIFIFYFYFIFILFYFWWGHKLTKSIARGKKQELVLTINF
jgi:uncharacterized membrane protein